MLHLLILQEITHNKTGLKQLEVQFIFFNEKINIPYAACKLHPQTRLWTIPMIIETCTQTFFSHLFFFISFFTLYL